MKAEDKAKELIERFNSIKGRYSFLTEESAKIAALICVEEIIDNINPCSTMSQKEYDEEANYWQEVKQHIEKHK